MFRKLSILLIFLASLVSPTLSPGGAAPPIQVSISTTEGDILLDLYPDKAPATVANFLEYADSGFYDQTIFHRVINSFMIQGGGFTSQFEKKPTQQPVKNEANNGLKNNTGTIAMARTRNPHSATAQFFINVNDNHFLNHSSQTNRGWGYAVFGKVTKGMDVVAKITNIPTGRAGPFPSDVPKKTIIIQSIKRIKH